MKPKESCGAYIHQIHNVMEKQVNNQLRKKGLTLSQMNVLIALVSTPEKKLSFKELEKRLALAQSTTAGLISRLGQKGLICVTGHPEDKRIKYVEMSALGMEYMENAEQEINHGEEKLLFCLTETEIETFRILLKKVAESFIKI